MHRRSLVLALVTANCAVLLFWFLVPRGDVGRESVARDAPVIVDDVRDDVDVADERADAKAMRAAIATAPTPEAASDATTPPDAPTTIEVRVVHAADEAALTDVRVRIRTHEDWLDGTSDANGIARFTVAPDAGWYALRVPPTPTTGEFYEQDLPDLRAGATIEIEARVRAGNALAGRCLDADGEPVAGALVRGWCGSSGSGRHDRETTTDTFGRWRLEHLGPDAWVDAIHLERGLVCEQGVCQHDPQDGPREGFDLVLVPSVALDLRVVDGSGRPVEDAFVHSFENAAVRTSTPYDGIVLKSPNRIYGRTDASGRLAIADLPPRTYEFVIDREPFRRYREYHVIDGSELVVTLDAGFGVSGVVYGPDGEPAVGARVHLGPSQMGDTLRNGTTTDENGRFRAQGLDEPNSLRYAPWLVVLHDGCAVHVEQPVEVDGGAVGASLEVHLVPGASITGRVRIEGDPVDQAFVQAVSERTMEASSFRRAAVHEVVAGSGGLYTDADGSFELTNLFRETYTLRVRPDPTRKLEFEFEIEAGAQDVELDVSAEQMRGVVLTGAVIDRVTGEPVPSFTVAPNGGRAVEGRDGTYEYAGLDAGRKWVFFRAEGYLESDVELSGLEPGEHIVDAVLMPRASLTLRVVDIDGRDWGHGGEIVARPTAAALARFEGLEIGRERQRRTCAQPLVYDELPACPVEFTVSVQGARVVTTVDLTGGGTHEHEVVVGGLTQHDHELRLLEASASASLDADEVVRRLRSNEPDDVAWVATRFDDGSLREPRGAVSIDLRLRDEVLMTSMISAYLRPQGDTFQLQLISDTALQLERALVPLRLAEGDWKLRASQRDLATHQLLPFDVHTDITRDGSALGVVLFVERE